MSIFHGIYAITDEAISPGLTHLKIADAAIRGGASVIQLRDKTSSDERLIEIGKDIHRLTSQAKALFIVNDRLKVALSCGADGLHIGQEDQDAAELRPLLLGKILGVSVETIDQAVRAKADGADYLGVGPIFCTSTKLDAGKPIGLKIIREIRNATGLPIVAIGGINESNIGDVARSGADSAAVISAIICTDDMIEATRGLLSIWQENTTDCPPSLKPRRTNR